MEGNVEGRKKSRELQSVVVEAARSVIILYIVLRKSKEDLLKKLNAEIQKHRKS